METNFQLNSINLEKGTQKSQSPFQCTLIMTYLKIIVFQTLAKKKLQLEISNINNLEKGMRIRMWKIQKEMVQNNTIERQENNNNNNEHIFCKHGKFIIIEQLRNINTTPTETLKLRLKERKFLDQKIKLRHHAA